MRARATVCVSVSDSVCMRVRVQTHTHMHTSFRCWQDAMVSRGTCMGFQTAGSLNKVLMLDENEKAPVPEEQWGGGKQGSPIRTLTDCCPDRDGI